MIEEKLLWIEENSKPRNEILIRTNLSKRSMGFGSGKWFVHYTYFMDSDDDFAYHEKHATVYKAYTDDLESALDDIIQIIKSEDKEKYDDSHTW